MFFISHEKIEWKTGEKKEGTAFRRGGRWEGPGGRDPADIEMDDLAEIRWVGSGVKGQQCGMRSDVWSPVSRLFLWAPSCLRTGTHRNDLENDKCSATCQKKSLKIHFWTGLFLLDLWFLTRIDNKNRIVINRNNLISNKTIITFEVWPNSYALFACFNSSFKPKCQRKSTVFPQEGLMRGTFLFKSRPMM